MIKGHKTAMLELSDYVLSDKGVFVDPDMMLKEFVNRVISKYGHHYITDRWLVQTTAKDGVKIHVDHIKPVSLFPMLKYDMDNLQVLCELCNIGKSNTDDTDWR